jgi:hypothetical protein
VVDRIGGNDLMALIFATDPGEHPPAAIPWVPAARPSLAGQAASDLRDAVTRPFRRLAGAPCLLRGPSRIFQGKHGSDSAFVLFLAAFQACRMRWLWTTRGMW